MNTDVGRYRPRKAETVTAVQFSYYDLAKLWPFFVNTRTTQVRALCSVPAKLEFVVGGTKFEVLEGDWIVKNDIGEIHTMPDSDFRDWYDVESMHITSTPPRPRR